MYLLKISEISAFLWLLLSIQHNHSSGWEPDFATFSSTEQFCVDVLSMAKDARQQTLGVFHPTFSLLQRVQESLMEKLPEDAHRRASGKLCVSLTRMADGKNVLVSEFESREELIQVQWSREKHWLGFTTSALILYQQTCPWCSSVLVFWPVSLCRFSCAAAFSLFTVDSLHLRSVEWWVDTLFTRFIPVHFSVLSLKTSADRFFRIS